jgi:hypothetical protein
VKSIREGQFSGASRACRRRRERRLFAFLLAAGCVFGGQSPAADLVIRRSAVQSIVVSALFNDQGRWYLTKGNCYAYLENPSISLASGRLVMDAHLSSHLGVEIGGSCVGPGLASNVQLSGKFFGSESQLTLEDIRIDNVQDEATRQALDLLQSVAGTSLPRAVNIDMMQVLKPAIVPGTDIKVTVATVTIAGVTTEPEHVTVSFDFKLRAD